MSRRQVLRFGAIGTLPSLADVLRCRAVRAADGSTSRMVSGNSVIVIFLYGGLSHIDTFDPKPDAPAEIRGAVKAIDTKLPGIQLSEYLPRLAATADKFSIIRSIVGAADEHSSSQFLSGWSDAQSTVIRRPGLGSVVSKLRGWGPSGNPPFIHVGESGYGGGLSPGYLGLQHKPFSPNLGGGSTPELELRGGMTVARLEARRELLHSIDGLQRYVDVSGAMDGMDAFSQRAFDLLTSDRIRRALDLSQENNNVVARYGKSKSLLTALRLVEAGTGCVAINLGRPPGWDLHQKIFKQLPYMVGDLDGPVAALIEDLNDRGLQKQVLVLVCSEFGRTPRINTEAGRHHWPNVMSCLLAGGGLQSGQVIGATDRWAAEATSNPYSIQNVLATVYHVLGIDPDTRFTDQSGRPIPLLGDGRPVLELL